MSYRFIFTIMFSLFIFLGCSNEKAKEKQQKQKTSEHIEKNLTISSTNPNNSQELEPGLHLSGTQNTHLSGSTQTTNHISGG